MKKIICIFSETLNHTRKKEIVERLRSYALALNMPFQIDLYSEELIKDGYHYAIVLFPPKNIIPNLPSLEYIVSLNAGVDDFIQTVYPQTKIGRIIHQPAINRMSEYVLYCILDYILLMDKHRKNQLVKNWDRTKPFAISKDAIGIMGMGNIGRRVVEQLKQMGKIVFGYSRTRNDFVSASFIQHERDVFLSQVNILVNALPLTKETFGILNKYTLNLLPDNSCLINVGRGGHIVEDDLLEALGTNKISKAYLDVFQLEPLPKDHPFWTHKKIFLTPHVSGIFDALDVLEEVIKHLKLFYEKGIVVNPIEH
jgi:glyoxylate/hydroxypyruvate reductase A